MEQRVFVSILFCSIHGQYEETTGWNFIPVPNQAFYMFIYYMEIIDSEGNILEGYGDGSSFSAPSYCSSNCFNFK